jgi:hypothetical protein
LWQPDFHRWGEPRATSDADFSALAPFGLEHNVVDVLLRRFEAWIASCGARALVSTWS